MRVEIDPLHTKDLLIVCPICGREQWIPTSEYLDHISLPGHPYTCGGEECPSHTEMIPRDPEVAAYKEAMNQHKGGSKP